MSNDDDDDTPVEVPRAVAGEITTAGDLPSFAGGTPVKRVAVAMLALASASKKDPCHFCKTITSRCIAFKGMTDPVWFFLHCCDYCMVAIKNAEFNPTGE